MLNNQRVRPVIRIWLESNIWRNASNAHIFRIDRRRSTRRGSKDDWRGFLRKKVGDKFCLSWCRSSLPTRSTRYKVNTSWKRLQLHPASPNTKLKSKNATMPKAGPSPNSPPWRPSRPWQEFLCISRHWWHDGPQGAIWLCHWVMGVEGATWKMNLRDLLETYREQDMWLCGKIYHISIQSHISSNLNSDTKLWTRSSSNGFVHATIQMKSFAANPWTVN